MRVSAVTSDKREVVEERERTSLLAARPVGGFVLNQPVEPDGTRRRLAKSFNQIHKDGNAFPASAFKEFPTKSPILNVETQVG